MMNGTISSYHIHSLFSDGKSSAEEIVNVAIEKGLAYLGFSDHGYTPYDDSYCIKDTENYIREICCLKQKYKDHIKILLGIEEDAFALVDRNKLDYIIGSCHYIYKDGRYYPIDTSYQHFEQCFALFDGDELAFAESYYSHFCDYILRRRPDIIGHFDLITKYDEKNQSCFLQNESYKKIASHYVGIAAQSGCLFEVNTGAISRGYRTSPYPSEALLWDLKKLDAGIILSSDSHRAETLDFGFEETKSYLRDIGFRYAYRLTELGPEKYEL